MRPGNSFMIQVPRDPHLNTGQPAASAATSSAVIAHGLPGGQVEQHHDFAPLVMTLNIQMITLLRLRPLGILEVLLDLFSIVTSIDFGIHRFTCFCEMLVECPC